MTHPSEPTTRRPLHLFEGYGIELEYMIVDRATLAVAPLCDQMLHSVAGEYVSDVEFGPISWSNELALHVIEMKTTDPVVGLDGLEGLFGENIHRANELLAPLGARLMPSAMHPFMDPNREMRLWPHDSSPPLRSLQSRLRLPRPRLGQPAIAPHQPAVRR